MPLFNLHRKNYNSQGLLTIVMRKSQKVYLLFKRLLDIALSFMGIFVCFALLWWWIFIINFFVTKFHPLFTQKRYGYHKNVFKIIKFRTMKITANSELPPSKMSGKEQYEMTTKFGLFLRKSQLDETLQLFNILIGQMSFVGLRPGAATNEEELVKAREQFTPNAYDVKPGLTGLAQIELKDKHNPLLKTEKDSEYVRNISFTLDVKIFFKTLFYKFKR